MWFQLHKTNFSNIASDKFLPDLVRKSILVTNFFPTSTILAKIVQFPMFLSPQCQWPKLFDHSFGFWNCSITSLVIVGMLFRKCVRVSVSMSMNKWAQGNILLTSTKYYLTNRMIYLVMWKNILPPIMDEQFSWMKKCIINKMNELSNEHWQYIKLHFPSSTTNFPNLYLKLHLLHLYCLAKSFLSLPCLCIYSIFIALHAIHSHGHSTIVSLFNSR